MRVLLLKINNCSDCPYFRPFFNTSLMVIGYNCLQANKIIARGPSGDFIHVPKIEEIPIPNWCPLEKMEERAKE